MKVSGVIYRPPSGPKFLNFPKFYCFLKIGNEFPKLLEICPILPIFFMFRFFVCLILFLHNLYLLLDVNILQGLLSLGMYNVGLITH